MKNIEEMSDHEMLVELMEDKRRNDVLRYVSYVVNGIFLLGIVVFCFIYVPRIKAFFAAYEQLIGEFEILKTDIYAYKDKIDGVMTTIDSFSRQFNADTFKKMDELMDQIQRFLDMFSIFGQ